MNPKLTSIQFHVQVPVACDDCEAVAYDMVVNQIQGFTALAGLYPYSIDVEYDDDDGEFIYYIVIISHKRGRFEGGKLSTPR